MTADLLCTVAHPDDESFGLGSLLAKAAASGARVVVVCGTRGDAGEDISGAGRKAAELGDVREQELRAAAEVLGVAEVEVLGLADSGWDGRLPEGALAAAGGALVDRLVEAMARHHPRVVVTMDPSGNDGHRDHAAIAVATTEAFARHDDPAASLYHWCLVRSLMDRWVAERTGGANQAKLGRPDADITTVLDTTDVLPVRRRAIAAHATQAAPFLGLSPELEAAFLAADHLVRVVPAWTGGPLEHELVGLRQTIST